MSPSNKKSKKTKGGNRTNGQNRVNDALVAEQQKQAYELRLKGKSYRLIAEEMGVSVGLAHQRVKQVIDSVIKPAGLELVTLELDRLDKYLEALDPKLQAGEPKAIATALRIGERRAKLLGMDAPEKLEVLETTQQDIALKELINEAKARNEAIKAVALQSNAYAEPTSDTSDQATTDVADTEVVDG